MARSTPSDARVFVLDIVQHARLFGRLFQRLALGSLLALLGVQLLWWWASQGTRHAVGLATRALSLLALVAFLSSFVGGWLWLLSVRYRLLLAPSWVGLDSGGRLHQRLERDEVEHLCEGSMGLVLVPSRGLPLRIPRSLKGYDSVRMELLAWRALTFAGQPGYRPWLGFTGKLTIVLASLILLGASALLLGVVNMLVGVMARS